MENEVQNAEVVTQVQDSAASAPESVSPANDAPAAEKTAPVAPAEKMIPQSQVSKIAAREAREAAERARNEANAQFERERAAWQTQNAQPQNVGGIQQQTPDQIRELIRQEAMKMSHQHMAKQIETSFLGKVSAARTENPEFADKYDALNIESHPDLVIMLDRMPNTAKIIEDLADNPSKFSNVLMLARSGAPQLAERELRRLSDSIKANVEAQKQPVADEPLGQLRPSNIGADNGDNMTVSDYMKIFTA